MNIVIHKTHGVFNISSYEVEEVIKAQLMMVPGIASVGTKNIFQKLGLVFSKNIYKDVIVTQIYRNTVSIECYINVFSETNFKQVAIEIQKVVKFAVEKKYGLIDKNVDVIIKHCIEG